MTLTKSKILFSYTWTHDCSKLYNINYTSHGTLTNNYHTQESRVCNFLKALIFIKKNSTVWEILLTISWSMMLNKWKINERNACTSKNLASCLFVTSNKLYERFGYSFEESVINICIFIINKIIIIYNRCQWHWQNYKCYCRIPERMSVHNYKI